MDTLPTLFGAASLATVALSKGDRRLVSYVLFASWGFSNIGWQWNVLDAFPAIDAVIAAMAFVLRFERDEAWRTRFLALAVTQLALDVAYSIVGARYVSTYLLLLDATFALELLIVSGGGLLDACHDFRAWVRRFRNGLSPHRQLLSQETLTDAG